MFAVDTKLLWLGLLAGLAVSPARAEVVEQAWAVRYGGPGAGKDGAQAVAMDAAGNVYVTGHSYADGTDYDFATLKYDAEGQQQWVRRYDGPSHGADWARHLVVDTVGNSYVAGFSAGADTKYDFATIKYDADGKLLWQARYDGPLHGDDRTKGVAVDADGNLYVTGESAGDSARVDAVTIKYGPDGKALWTARYAADRSLANAPEAVALDREGNVYVTGGSTIRGGKHDYFTLKYDAEGKQLWAVHRDWSGHDHAVSVAVDRRGNVYVTGASVRHRDQAGEKTANTDIATVKYGPDGTELWTAAFHGGGNADDTPAGLVTDQQGSVYVTGTTQGSGANSTADYVALRYDADGKELWAARYSRTRSSRDTTSSMATDAAGNVYVLGTSQVGSAQDADYVIVKYGPDGAEHWTARYEAKGNQWGQALALDRLGNVCATGTSDAGDDYLTVKYSQPQ